MGDSIGSALSSSVNAAVQRMREQATAAARARTSGSSPFADALGAALIADGGASIADGGATPESVDDIWKRVELQQSAMHGQGDALMATLRQAADERWERRDRMEHGGFDLSDFV